MDTSSSAFFTTCPSVGFESVNSECAKAGKLIVVVTMAAAATGIKRFIILFTAPFSLAIIHHLLYKKIMNYL